MLKPYPILCAVTPYTFCELYRLLETVEFVELTSIINRPMTFLWFIRHCFIDNHSVNSSSHSVKGDIAIQ